MRYQHVWKQGYIQPKTAQELKVFPREQQLKMGGQKQETVPLFLS